MKQIVANVAEQDASHAAIGLCQIRIGLPCPGSVRIEEVIGQEHAKRALEVAIAGGHHILLTGPTGVGKTTLALAAASILPPLQPGEIAKPGVQLPVQLPMGGRGSARPFVFLGHTTATEDFALCKDGRLPLAALADRGVLVLDDLPLFQPRFLAALRQVLDARMAGPYPARFILVATMNSCPCGAGGAAGCSCSPAEIRAWRRRVPVALLDRIDIHITMPPVPAEKLLARGSGEAAEAVQARIQKAWGIQKARFSGASICWNAEMPPGMVFRYCKLGEGAELMKAALRQLRFTARRYFASLRIARTVADLDGEMSIQVHHLAEAIQYRRETVWG